jgi:hypothetical protein
MAREAGRDVSAAARGPSPAARFCAAPASSDAIRRRAKFCGLRWRVERVRPADSWTWAPGRHVATRAPGGPLRPGARVKHLTDGRRRGAHRWHAAGAALRPPSSLAGELSRRRAKPLLRLRPPNCARLRDTPTAVGSRARRAARRAARGAAAARRGTLEAHLASRLLPEAVFGTYKGTTRVAADASRQ